MNGKGVGLGVVMFVVFLALKVAPSVPTWSWWLVTAPLWIPVAVTVVAVIIAAIAKAVRR